MQPLPAAPDRAEELVEVDLERREDAVGPVLHLEARLPRLAAGLLDDVLRLALGELHDLGLRRLAHGLLARLADQAVALALRLGEHLLPLLHDPAGLLDLLGDRRAHLVEDVVDLLAVDAHLVGQGHGLRVVHEIVELVDEYEDVHGPDGTRGAGCACAAGGSVLRAERGAGAAVRVQLAEPLARPRGVTSPSTLPPNDAISLTPLEETKAYCGLDMTYIVSISGASRWLSRFIWNSHSKSAITRRPFTIVRAPCLRANSTTSSLNTSTTTFVDVRERVLEERDALLDREQSSACGAGRGRPRRRPGRRSPPRAGSRRRDRA